MKQTNKTNLSLTKSFNKTKYIFILQFWSAQAGTIIILYALSSLLGGSRPSRQCSNFPIPTACFIVTSFSARRLGWSLQWPDVLMQQYGSCSASSVHLLMVNWSQMPLCPCKWPPKVTAVCRWGWGPTAWGTALASEEHSCTMSGRILTQNWTDFGHTETKGQTDLNDVLQSFL